MPTRSADSTAQQNAPARAQGGVPRRRGRPQPRMPSTVGYMAVAGGLSLALFWGIWALLRSEGDEAPWIPAGLSAGLVIFIAAAAREIAMR
ncbi:MAG: hypothetical protein H7Z38_15760, partial [Rubrivivax sp.]|nr:hypothetical protein [Pyrinomonadaceae bacterium]